MLSSPLVDLRALRQRCRQLLEAARCRYQALSYLEKDVLVDELVELSGYHRKSVLRLFTLQSGAQVLLIYATARGDTKTNILYIIY